MKKTTRTAIAADSPHTAAAGARIAREGGNAVDIAAAAALTATVSETLMCSLAGSAFCMVRMPGADPELIEGSDAMPTVSVAPSEECSSWRLVQIPYGDGITIQAGHASVAVPGMPAAIESAWKRHGSLPWKEIVQPALELARKGFTVEPTMAKWLNLAGRALFYQQPASRECFFTEGDEPLKQGEYKRIPHLHQTMQVIADEGIRALYEGDLAAVIAREMQENGGFITREDLAAYRAEIRKPLSLTSRGYELALNPPPAVGGAALGSLIGLIEKAWQDEATPAQRALLHARAQTHLLKLRETTFGNPAFDEKIARNLLEPETLQRHHGALSSPNTTHISVMTADGGMVALTMSCGYGSGIVIPGTGIACNNSLGEPELNPQGYHAAKPGTRMVSNMSPTLAWRQDGHNVAFGSPGASRITTASAQMWSRFVLEGLPLQDAVVAPRLHIEQWDDGLRAQCEPGIDSSLLEAEYKVRHFESRDMFFGAVKIAALDNNGDLIALADDRRYGAIEIV